MDRSEEGGLKSSEKSSERLCVTDALTAEHIRVILALNEIRAAVIERDPLRLAIGSAEVLVAAVDRARAQEALEKSLLANHAQDWNCSTCGELVPNAFDVCWNCGAPDASFGPSAQGHEETLGHGTGPRPQLK